VFLFLLSNAFAREEINSLGRTVWFEADILGRKVRVKAMAHAGDVGEPAMTLMHAEESV
jgi:hypothetical protein